MSRTPLIALKRRAFTIANFAKKLDVLEQLISDGMLSNAPVRASIPAFAAWADEELGVRPLSRSVIYDELEDYVKLRQRMDTLLKALTDARCRSQKKVNREQLLSQQLRDAREKLQSYVNQYAEVCAALDEATKEIKRLNQRLNRAISHAAKVTPLRTANNQ